MGADTEPISIYARMVACMTKEWNNGRFIPVVLLLGLAVAIPVAPPSLGAVASDCTAESQEINTELVSNSCNTSFVSNTATDCGFWVTWVGEVEFEGTSGAAEGEMGCDPTVSCEVSTSKVACTLEEDANDGDLICDIEKTEDGTFNAQIECEDPILPGRYVKKSISVEDGVVVDVQVELGPLIQEFEEMPRALKSPGTDK